MPHNRVFFPQDALDRWLAEGRIELSGAELTIPDERRRYRLIEAVRIVAEAAGAPDSNELVGRVKTVLYLTELGAELLGDSMVLGDNAYRVVQGWLGSPIGTLQEHRATEPAPPRLDALARSDEELLAAFLIRAL